MSLVAQERPGGGQSSSWRRSLKSRWLAPLAIAIALGVLSPLLFLVLQAFSVGRSDLAAILWRSLTARLLINSVGLVVAVSVSAAVLGSMVAIWLDRLSPRMASFILPLVVLPVAIPDFLVSYGWRTLFPALHGFGAACLVMVLASFPLVGLPAFAALRGMDRSALEVAQSLGASRWRRGVLIFAQIRSAVVGGSLLVALVVLAEYGAFEILGFQTFTTEIFTQFKVGFDATGACALSLVVVLLSILAVGIEVPLSGPRLHLRGSGPLKEGDRSRSQVAAFLGLGITAALGLGVPLGAIAYLMLAGPPASLPSASVFAPLWHSASYAAGAALIVTLAALPVALLTRRGSGRLGQIVERFTFLVMAVPGLVVALGFTWATQRFGRGFGYQSAWLLIAAYSVIFFPLGLVSVRASVAQSSYRFEELARSLGASPSAAFRRVTLPMLVPGILSALSLVFLAALTELTATLVLIPTGSSTLSSEFWTFETNASYGQAAPFALAMVLLGAVPTVALSRYFDRRPSRQGADI